MCTYMQRVLLTPSVSTVSIFELYGSQFITLCLLVVVLVSRPGECGVRSAFLNHYTPVDQHPAVWVLGEALCNYTFICIGALQIILAKAAHPVRIAKARRTFPLALKPHENRCHEGPGYAMWVEPEMVVVELCSTVGIQSVSQPKNKCKDSVEEGHNS